MDQEHVRQRLRITKQLDFFSDDALPLACLWRFPHLEAVNHSWTFCEILGRQHGILRVASWDRFQYYHNPHDSQFIISDYPISEDDLIMVIEVLTDISIIGCQKGGIYDGSRYGRDLFDSSGFHVRSCSRPSALTWQ